MVFGRLRNSVRNLLRRPLDLASELEQCWKKEAPFELDELEPVLHLKPVSADVEEAIESARRGEFEHAGSVLWDHFERRIRPRVFVHSAEVELIRSLVERDTVKVQRCKALAARIMAHEFCPLGTEKVSFPAAIDWFSDFKGSSWVCAHVEELRRHLCRPPSLWEEESDEGAGGIGDVVATWEFNRLGHLVELGRAFWLTSGEPYVSEYIAQAVDWSERNPALCGINWLDPETIAVRNLYWLSSWLLFLPSKQLRGRILLRLLQTQLIHGVVLAGLLQRGTGAGLACSCSLYILALALPEFAESAGWLDIAGRRLKRALKEEFDLDGFHRLGATQKHRFALEWLLLVGLLCELNQVLPPEGVLSVVEAGLDGVVAIYPGMLPVTEIGSVYGSGLLSLRAPGIENVETVLGLGALVTGRNDLAGLLPQFPWHVYWWGGSWASDRYSALGGEKPVISTRFFSSGGMAVSRDSWSEDCSWCLLRTGIPAGGISGEAGLLPPPPAPLSWHDDLLSLNMVLAGEPFLIEPGVPGGMGKVALYLSSLSAHSTVRILREMEPLSTEPVRFERSDGEPRSDGRPIAGAKAVDDGVLLWGKRQVVLLPEQPWCLSRDVLFLAGKKCVVIRDSLDGEGQVEMEANFIFSPHIDVLMRGDMGCLVRGEKLQARLLPVFPRRFRYRLSRGSLSPLRGWVWLGRMVPAYHLQYVSKLQAPWVIYFWITWGGNESPLPKGEQIEKMFLQAFS